MVQWVNNTLKSELHYFSSNCLLWVNRQNKSHFNLPWYNFFITIFNKLLLTSVLSHYNQQSEKKYRRSQRMLLLLLSRSDCYCYWQHYLTCIILCCFAVIYLTYCLTVLSSFHHALFSESCHNENFCFPAYRTVYKSY